MGKPKRNRSKQLAAKRQRRTKRQAGTNKPDHAEWNAGWEGGRERALTIKAINTARNEAKRQRELESETFNETDE